MTAHLIRPIYYIIICIVLLNRRNRVFEEFFGMNVGETTLLFFEVTLHCINGDS